MAARDPRYYQIAVLGLLLFWGVSRLGFPVGQGEIALLVATALGTQYALGRLVGVRFDPRSPLISALSLGLLARAAAPGYLALTAIAAIGSKFLIRRRGKHVFNPTAFGLAALALATDRVWISPGQWGSGATLAFLVACAGGLVVYRAARSDVTWAFLVSYALLVLGRAAWLGDPLAVPLHSLGGGSLLVFAFFMISDPKTTPDSRAGRLVYAALVAAGAASVHFLLFRPNGFVWALVAAAPLVPLLDSVFPGERYRWDRRPGRRPPTGRRRPFPPISEEPVAMPIPHPARRPRLAARALPLALAVGSVLAAAAPAGAFCGFYVAKADSSLFNQASQVVLARHGDRTVLTMANDFRGDPTEFAIVVPVPTVLERDQIRVADQSLIDHLDAYTAPRLVEYFDPDPCRRAVEERSRLGQLLRRPASAGADAEAARALGVTIEARYTVGEYDILILSAEESQGLETWLVDNGYRLPAGAGRVLGSYLRQGMRFFVARVDLEERSRLGFTHLRPLQMAFETPRFMLPIRLGTVNADGPQELFVYTLTRRGRVETTNYRTRRLPTGQEVPVYVKEEFGDFYRDLFTTQVERDGMRSVYLEYAWDMAWCDPCAADPLSVAELRQLGVFWLDPAARGPARDVFVTRLHARYDRQHFPADLRFQETGDRTNFQGRYVLRHPWRGEARCAAAEGYRQALAERLEREARTLADLTGWDLETIRRRIGRPGPRPASEEPWWRTLWDRGR